MCIGRLEPRLGVKISDICISSYNKWTVIRSRGRVEIVRLRSLWKFHHGHRPRCMSPSTYAVIAVVVENLRDAVVVTISKIDIDETLEKVASPRS